MQRGEWRGEGEGQPDEGLQQAKTGDASDDDDDGTEKDGEGDNEERLLRARRGGAGAAPTRAGTLTSLY